MYLLYVDLNSAFNIIVMTFYLHLEGCARACRRAGKDSKAGRKSQHKAGATRKPRPSQKGKPVWQREARKASQEGKPARQASKASQEGKPARQGKKASQKGKPERQARKASQSGKGKQERQAREASRLYLGSQANIKRGHHFIDCHNGLDIWQACLVVSW